MGELTIRNAVATRSAGCSLVLILSFFPRSCAGVTPILDLLEGKREETHPHCAGEH